MTWSDSLYSSKLVHGSIVYNNPKYLKNKEGDKENNEKFIGNWKRLCLKVMKIKKLEG